MAKKTGGLNWQPWKQSAKDAVEAIYVGVLKKYGIKDPIVHTIHKDGAATVAGDENTLAKLDNIPGMFVLSGVTGDGRIKVYAAEVDAWFEAGNIPFWTDEERAAQGGKGNPETEAEKAKRKAREDKAAEIAARFEARKAKWGLPPKAADSDNDGGETDNDE